jgi:hypothetical protein
VNRVEDLPYRIEQLLGSKKLAEMGRAARSLGRPDAARDVCREVVRRAGRAEVRSENAGANPLKAGIPIA